MGYPRNNPTRTTSSGGYLDCINSGSECGTPYPIPCSSTNESIPDEGGDAWPLPADIYEGEYFFTIIAIKL